MVQNKVMICLISYHWSTAAADCRNLPSVSTLFECPEVEGHFIHWLPTSKKHSVAFPRERSQCRRSISQPEPRWSGYMFWTVQNQRVLKGLGLRVLGPCGSWRLTLPNRVASGLPRQGNQNGRFGDESPKKHEWNLSEHVGCATILLKDCLTGWLKKLISGP